MSPRFWTGDTGRAIRALGDDATIVAMYLLTAPGSNMIGLYYLALPTLAHETGRSLQAATKALARLGEVGFAHYDAERETVYMPEMARHQIGRSISPNDRQRIGVVNQLHEHSTCSFVKDFWEKYAQAYALPGACPYRGPVGCHVAATWQPPSQAQEQAQAQATATDSERATPDESPPPNGHPDPVPVNAPPVPDAPPGPTDTRPENPRPLPVASCPSVEYVIAPTTGVEMAYALSEGSGNVVSPHATNKQLLELKEVCTNGSTKLDLDDLRVIGLAIASGKALGFLKERPIEIRSLVHDGGKHLFAAFVATEKWANRGK